MKKLLFIFILSLFIGCKSNRYFLSDSGKDKMFLIERINEMSEKGLISKKPIIVLDGVPLRFNHELKKKRLSLSKKEIKSIQLIKKEVGIRLYGDFAKGGVLVITKK